MHGANPRDAIHSFNIRCSSSGKTILEQVLGQPSAVVGIGEDEFGLRYNLMAPVVDDGALELYQQARQYAARLAGSTPNGRIDRTRCRTISPASGIAFDLHTLRHSLHSALLVEVLRKYGSEAQEGNGQPKLDRTPDLTTPAQGLDKPNGGNTALFVLAGTRSDSWCLVERSGFGVRCRQAAIIFSFVIGIASKNVCIGFLPKHQRP
jgi:hypothetical protein